MDGEME
jgi:hypothetical protein